MIKYLCVGLIFSLLIFTSCDDINEEETKFKDYSKLWFEIDGNGEFVEVNTTNFTSNNNYTPVYVDKNDLGENYLIGTFYIDNFDKYKARANVMSTIIDVINDYDIIAIQGIKDVEVIETLNELLPEYDWKASPKMGENEEQMIFLFSDRVKAGKSDLYPYDGFDKTPYTMSFMINDLQEIVLIQVDINPLDAEEELGHLKEVYKWARRHYLGNDGNNIYLMGNMYADCVYFDSYYILEMYQILINEEVDTTTGFTNCSYDRILTDEVDPKFMGVGVDNLSDETESIEEIKAVSERYPVYFVFEKLSKDE